METLANLIVTILDDDLRARRARLAQRRVDHIGHEARAQFWRDYEANRYAREADAAQQRRDALHIVRTA